MHYNIWSDYNLMRNAHQVSISRASMRSKPERLVWKWVERDVGAEVPGESFMDLDEHELKQFFQAMLDKAWSLGLRPEHYQQDTKELQAARYHLEDMRKLVFMPLQKVYEAKP